MNALLPDPKASAGLERLLNLKVALESRPSTFWEDLDQGLWMYDGGGIKTELTWVLWTTVLFKAFFTLSSLTWGRCKVSGLLYSIVCVCVFSTFLVLACAADDTAFKDAGSYLCRYTDQTRSKFVAPQSSVAQVCVSFAARVRVCMC